MTKTAAFSRSFAAQIAAASKEANRGCGSVYELYERRFHDAVEQLLDRVPEEHLTEALRIAGEHGNPGGDTEEQALEEPYWKRGRDICPVTEIGTDYCPCGRHE